LAALERDLKRLLASWFDVGFLELRRITWDSPASLLEKLISYEAVHAINSWTDLKHRLGKDRRIFAFFHPKMPDEPLIFVQVAFVNGIAGNIQVLLDESTPSLDPQEADTAIFYSISNAQAGLAGISFGDFLIKRVVQLLLSEFKGLKTFATLSPLPGFRKWLEAEFKTEADKTLVSLTPTERKSLSLADGAVDRVALSALLERADWREDARLAEPLAKILQRLSAVYLVEAKRRPGVALDPVARFHLSNGARIERLNPLANISDDGMAQAYGMMVNYRYKLKDIEANHEAYRGEGEVRTSSAVQGLLKG